MAPPPVGSKPRKGACLMNPIWYVLIGYVLGQFTVVFAGYLGEVLKERYNELP